MLVLRLTSVGKLLVGERRVAKQISQADTTIGRNWSQSLLTQIRKRGEVAVDADLISQGQDNIKELIDAGLVKETTTKMTQAERSQFLSIAVFEAINFDLTYQCNSTCGHCWQWPPETKTRLPLLTTTDVKRIMAEANFAGIMNRGVNYSGGEPLLYRPDILELITYSRNLGTNIRLNTNAWWGKRTDFQIGGYTFRNSQELVRHLKECGLSLLVVSLDGLEESHDCRRREPGLFQRVLDVIDCCVKESLWVRVLATGVEREERESLTKLVKARSGVEADTIVRPKGMQGRTGLGLRDKVDIGHAAENLPAGPPNIVFDKAFFKQPELRCGGKGFSRPGYLHIDPDGNVKTCELAMGLSNLGNAREESIITMLNRFPGDNVSKTFYDHFSRRKKTIPAAAKRLFRPVVYKRFSHPCTAMVVLTNLLQAEGIFMSQNTSSPTERDILGFNLTVADSLNLLDPTSTLHP